MSGKLQSLVCGEKLSFVIKVKIIGYDVFHTLFFVGVSTDSFGAFWRIIGLHLWLQILREGRRLLCHKLLGVLARDKNRL